MFCLKYSIHYKSFVFMYLYSFKINSWTEIHINVKIANNQIKI